MRGHGEMGERGHGEMGRERKGRTPVGNMLWLVVPADVEFVVKFYLLACTTMHPGPVLSV